MDFTDVIHKRRMVRNFTADPVPAVALERILDAARRGPSAGFTQGQDFVVVTSTATKQQIAQLCGEARYVQGGFDPFISGAPLLIVPCTNENAYHRRYQQPDKINKDGSEIEWPVPYWFMDVGCAVMLLLLAVVNEGLAAGFAGAHDLAALRALLNIPDEVTPVGVIPLATLPPTNLHPPSNAAVVPNETSSIRKSGNIDEQYYQRLLPHLRAVPISTHPIARHFSR